MADIKPIDMPASDPSAPPIAEPARRPPPVRWTGGLRSFRVQVALGLAGVAIAVAAVLSVALGSLLAQRSERDKVAELRAIANNAAKLLSDGLTLRSRQVELLATASSLWEKGLSSDRVVQAISGLQTVTPHSAWIGVVSPDGIVRYATGGILVGTDISARPWFQAGKAGTHVGDVHPAKLLAALLPYGSDGGPQRFVDFASPIHQDGRLIGVIGMHGNWAWAHAVAESLMPEDAAERHLEVFILDRQGQVIYGKGETPPGDLHIQVGTGGQVRDEAFLTVAAKVHPEVPMLELGWTVVAREPTASALAEARRGVRRALLLGGLCALAASVLGWLLAGRLTRPLRRIADAAGGIEAEAGSFSMPRVAGSTEVAQLSAALAGMTERLQRAHQELEARVRERTVALELANVELDRQARSDALTGLLNRRGMEEQFRRALAGARRRHGALSVLLVDVDHFKQVNDVFGHETGDAALTALARVMRDRLRETDIVARLGGEEFVAILPDTDAAQAREVARALVERVAAEPINEVGRITISCGVAQVRVGSDSLSSVLNRADTAVYRAKHDGRNQARFADTEFELSPEDLTASR